MANFCGGIKLNPDTFEIRKGIITLVDTHPDDPLEEVNTPCSQLYDSIIFERVKHNGAWIMTAAGVDTDIPLVNIVTASCGAKFDGRFFDKDETGVLNFTDRHILEVLVNPADVDYTIEVSLTSSLQDYIDPFPGTTNIFPLDEIDGNYTVSVSATGYDTATEMFDASSDVIQQITLTPSAG